MGKYITKRILLALVTAFVVASATFFIMNMVPGGPFLGEKAVTPAAQEALEAKFGLDKPLSEQYTTYMNDLLHGDLGPSLKKRGRTVNDIIATKFPVSARLGGMAILIAFFVFGHACYKMGAGHARQAIEIEHIRQLELPTQDTPDVSPKMVEDEAAR